MEGVAAEAPKDEKVSVKDDVQDDPEVPKEDAVQESGVQEEVIAQTDEQQR